MVLFSSSFYKPRSEQGRNPPVFHISVYVTFFIDRLGEFLVASMISQHSHIKVQSLHQLSLYNCSYFYSYLWMHRLMQMQDDGKHGSPPGPTLQCGIAATCLLQKKNLLFCAHSHGRASMDLPAFWHEKNVWTEHCLKNASRLCGRHYPKVTSWVTPANGPRKTAAVNQAMNFLVTGSFLFNYFTTTYSKLYSLGCQESVFFSLSTQWFITYWELQKRKLSKTSC